MVDNSNQFNDKSYFSSDQNSLLFDQFDDDLKLEYMDLDEFLTENDVPIETISLEHLDRLQEYRFDELQPDRQEHIHPHQKLLKQASPSQQKHLKSSLNQFPQQFDQPQKKSPTTQMTINPASRIESGKQPQMVEPTKFAESSTVQSLGTDCHSSQSNFRAQEISYLKNLPIFPGSTRQGSSGLFDQGGFKSNRPECKFDGKLVHENPMDSSVKSPDEFGQFTSFCRKRKKQNISDKFKDDKYWEKRRKNNISAKRSRDTRRAKENQVALRAIVLERENKLLMQELRKARAENQILKQRLSLYEMV